MIVSAPLEELRLPLNTSHGTRKLFALDFSKSTLLLIRR